MPDALDFEQPLLELETQIAQLRASPDAAQVAGELRKLEDRKRRLEKRRSSSSPTRK